VIGVPTRPSEPGNVRVLPPGSPTPPQAPYEGGYHEEQCCMAEVDRWHVPASAGVRWEPEDTGLYCTRTPHGDDGPHVCELRAEADGEVTVVVVWGGE